jgi:hypothetical protein
MLHPDASYNRAVAYLGRAESSAARPGDLGRAAAALAETLSLRRGDAEAEAALSAVRAEIARRRARESGESVAVRPAPLRAAADFVSEDSWNWIAIFGSALLTFGLVLLGVRRTVPARLTAAVAMSVGAMTLGLGGSLGVLAHHYRTTSTPAVVVAPEARLLDESGVPVADSAKASTISEGASVFILNERGRLAFVEWGELKGWVLRSQLRPIPRAP